MAKLLHFHRPDTHMIHTQMSSKENFVLGLSNFGAHDPSPNPFNDRTGIQLFDPNHAAAHTSSKKATRLPVHLGQHVYPAVSTNTVTRAAKKRVQLQHPSAAIQPTSNVTLWLQQNRPDVLDQMAQQENFANLSTLSTSVAPLVPGVPANFVAPPVPM
jgi:hypothetical protein